MEDTPKPDQTPQMQDAHSSFMMLYLPESSRIAPEKLGR